MRFIGKSLLMLGLLELVALHPGRAKVTNMKTARHHWISVRGPCVRVRYGEPGRIPS